MTTDCLNSLVVDVDAITELKKKAIADYNKFINGLFRGYKNDYKLLLNKINFIETYYDLDNSQLIYEYYMTHGM